MSYAPAGFTIELLREDGEHHRWRAAVPKQPDDLDDVDADGLSDQPPNGPGNRAPQNRLGCANDGGPGPTGSSKLP